jgi:hypothetical protein
LSSRPHPAACLLLLTLSLALASSAAAQRPRPVAYPCCSITAIDIGAGPTTPHEPTNGVVAPHEPTNGLVKPSEPVNELGTPHEPTNGRVTPHEPTNGLVTAVETATGRQFQFRVTDRSLLSSLKVGQKVQADFGARTVRINSGAPCCEIVSTAQR